MNAFGNKYLVRLATYFAVVNLLPICAVIAEAQSSSRNVSKQNQTAVTITGTVSGIEKDPLFPPSVIPVAVTDEKDGAMNLELTDEALNKHSAKVDRNGKFRLKLSREFVPAGKKLMILILTAQGLRRLNHAGKAVVLQFNNKTTTINLGTIEIDKKSQ